MKPYYEHAGITIYHGDCREVLPKLSGIHCTVTSPPYNQRLNKFKPSGFKKGQQWADRAASSYFDDVPEGEYQAIQVFVLDLLYDATTEDGSLFYNHKVRWRNGQCLHPVQWTSSSKWNLRQEVIWMRDGSLTQNARMFPPNEERILWMDKGSHKWNQDYARHLSVWRIDSEKMSPHPVAYPQAIPTRCIGATTDVGDTVLDPYCGSGTTLRAAKDIGRKAIGIEISERYCEIAAKRLQQEVLFA